MAFVSATAGRAADEAVAASGPPFNVAVFVNTHRDQCYSRGYKAAAERLSRDAASEINKLGGVHGRPVELKFFDNEANGQAAIANVRAALGEGQLLAMIGLSSSQRGREVLKAIGSEIHRSRVPFISHLSISDDFKNYDNVFSTRPTQEIERVPVMVEFIKSQKISSIAFLGRKDAAYIESIASALKEKLITVPIIADHRISARNNGGDNVLDAEELARAIADLKANPPGMLILAVGTSLSDEVIYDLKTAGITTPILTVGRFTKDVIRSAADFGAAIYGMTWAALPEVESDRTLNVLGKGRPQDWLFAGEKVSEAPKWRNGLCPSQYSRDAFSEDNLRAAERGAAFADMVKLVATSAGRAGRGETIETYRKQVLSELTETYAVGRGAFQGTFENWSFHPDSRVRAQTPFIVILPQGIGRTQLTPQQFVRLNDKSLKQIETVYLDVDLIRTHGVDNNRKSFFAEFYLAMRVSDSITIDDIEFTNAFLDPRASRDQRTRGREISIEVLHPGGNSDAYPRDMRMYKVAGRFRFRPDFSTYPFDTQQFSIDLQPRSGDKTFIVQPPPAKLRNAVAESEGWIPDRQYVSFVDDFVPIVDAFTHRPSIVPFYNVRFVWQMKRETTDYYIRVIVPLLFILIVAYLSIFIPKSHLEAIVTIQITALLAAVALYLSLPEIDTDTATISDRIFMFDYMMVSLMIVISILRINARIVAIPWINQVLNFVHIVVVPAVLATAVLYLTQTSIIEGFDDLPGWQLLGLR